MIRIPAGALGEQAGPDLLPSSWSNLSGPWSDLLRAVAPRGLRPVQQRFVAEGHLLGSRRNLVVIAPTNGGKSLVGDLVVLTELAKGRRALVIEPLRALAQQRAAELKDLASLSAPGVLQRVPRVRLTTGDYRLENEDLTSAPPERGEIVVATPERVEAIMRHPSGAGWLATIGAVVVDEAHLVADPRRGPTIEMVIARFNSLPAPPRIVLLSATVGEPERLQAWLKPADLLVEHRRTPPLELEVWHLSEDDEPDQVLRAEIEAVLGQPDSAVLIFVYRRADADALARKFTTSGTTWAGGVGAFHAGQSAAQRERARGDFTTGATRVLVTTTALALGLNLPATHVYVRDSWFPGHGPLGTDQLLQMTGRAGRGDRAGRATVLARGRAGDAELLAEALRRRDVAPVHSAFGAVSQRWTKKATEPSKGPSLVASLLAQGGEAGMADSEVSAFANAMLAGPAFAAEVGPALRWLSGSDVAMAYRGEDGRWKLTRLGERAVAAYLPLPYAAGFGRLLRDLLSLEGTRAGLLGKWTDLDHLLLVELLREDARPLRRFSEALAGQVDGWMEARAGGHPVLFEWVRGDAEHSRAFELLGSICGAGESSGKARERAYLATAHAIVLAERGRGAAIADLERQWKMTGLGGAEERWRDTTMWLLAGHARVLDLPVFYHHLLEGCGAGQDRVREAKRSLGHMRRGALDLIETVKYCSPLGPLARGVKNMLKDSDQQAIGAGTLARLETGGFTSMASVAKASMEELVAVGVRKDLAKQVVRYCRMRMR